MLTTTFPQFVAAQPRGSRCFAYHLNIRGFYCWVYVSVRPVSDKQDRPSLFLRIVPDSLSIDPHSYYMAIDGITFSSDTVLVPLPKRGSRTIQLLFTDVETGVAMHDCQYSLTVAGKVPALSLNLPGYLSPADLKYMYYHQA